MAINLARTVQGAMRTVSRLGLAGSVTLVRTTKGTYNPVTDTETSTTQNYSVVNVTIGPYRAPQGVGVGESYEAGSLRLTNSRTLTFAALDCPVAPQMGDQWTFGGRTWATLHVTSADPTGTTPALWVVGVTR